MDTLSDHLNLFGIVLEIFGFAMLWPHIKRFLHGKITQKQTEIAKKAEGAYVGSPGRTISNKFNKLWRKIENIAIPLVLAGLVFQGLSTYFHN